MMMMPPGVLTAHAEYSVCPTKYKLSKTFTGLAYHVSRAGAPAGRGAVAAAGRGAGGAGAVHSRVASAAYSEPAAAFAAATCPSTVPGDGCAAAAAIARLTAMTMLAR